MGYWQIRRLARVRIRVTLYGEARPAPELREHMIDHTNRFLTRMLGQRSRRVPRIPRRRVDQGGFTEILRHPGARALAEHWWKRVLGD